jgi:Replicase family
MAAAAKQLALFTATRLPHHPNCTEKYDSGYRPKIRNVDNALRYRYIQANAPTIVWRLVFDLDYAGAAFAYESANLPPFSWSATNPQNGHAHVAFELEIPVNMIDMSTKAACFLVNIEKAIGKRLKADRAFAGYLIKNPIHKHWKTLEHRQKPYSLWELAEWVDVELKAPKIKSSKNLNEDIYSVGRNFSMFELLRKWAYKAIREYWRPNGLEAWRQACHNKIDEIWSSDEINWGVKSHGYGSNERRATSKSVADWTWCNTTPASFQRFIDSTHSLLQQSERGKKSGEVRARAREFKRSKALEMKSEHYSNKQIANSLKVTQRTLRNYLK